MWMNEKMEKKKVNQMQEMVEKINFDAAMMQIWSGVCT